MMAIFYRGNNGTMKTPLFLFIPQGSDLLTALSPHITNELGKLLVPGDIPPQTFEICGKFITLVAERMKYFVWNHTWGVNRGSS